MIPPACSHGLRLPARFPIRATLTAGRCLATLLAWSLWLGVSTVRAAQEAPAAASEPADFDMVATLAELARRMNFRVNPYANLERAEAAAHAASRTTDPDQQRAWKLRRAQQLLLGGQAAQAVAAYQELLAALDEDGQPERRRARRLEYREALATAWLRLGEEQNCLCATGRGSCLVPIRAEAVHTQPEGSENALRLALEDLGQVPDDWSRRWVANLAAMTLGRHPDALPDEFVIPQRVFESRREFPPFDEVAAAAGVAVNGLSGGAIMEDFNGDGRLDLMASSWGVRDPLRLFLQQGEPWRFEETTAAAGLAGQWGGLNLVHADYDNDGDADVLVLRGAWMFQYGEHPNSLLRNRGDGTFEDVTAAAGVLSFRPSHTAVWWDYDSDGWLDLFVGNESFGDTEHPCELYHNEGDGTFREVAAACGLDAVAFVKGASAGDYDNDGDADLFLSVLGAGNRLYRNDGAAGPAGAVRFQEVGEAAGVTLPTYGFATWFWDHDNDGWLDLLVAGYFDFESPVAGEIARLYAGAGSRLETPRLYHNRGDGTFEDRTSSAGFDRVVLVMGASFGDLDNDGFEDVLFGTGAPDFRALLPNALLWNDGGRGFLDVSAAAGLSHLQKGHGVAFGDLDGDGDQDLYQVLGGAYEGDVFPNVLYRNPGFGNAWITLRLRGHESNRSGIGTRVQVHVATPDGTRDVHRHVNAGGSFGSQSLQQEIGLGRATRIERLTLRWPSGTVQQHDDVAVNAVYEVEEGGELRRIGDS